MHAPLRAAHRVEWCGLDSLAAVADECRALADRAAESNVFYDPAFMLAAAPVFGAGAGAVLVRSTMSRRLIGLFPARIEPWRGGFASMLVGWTHPFAPLGIPLVDSAEPETAIAAWLEFLGSSTMPGLMLLPLIPENGAFANALDTVLQRTGRQNARFGQHRRACLDPGAARSNYLEQAVSAGRRKELRRLRRRLEDIAPVTFDTVAGDEVDAALKDFCVLEASGWKGLAGTAIVNDPSIKAFVRGAVTALAANGRARIDRMFLNGRAIAASITLQSGETAWCWKIAYSEGVARFSPGVQLVLDLTDDLLRKPSPLRVDSCAVADHPMIDHIWRERLTLSDRLIALRPSALSFPAACALETLRRSALDGARALRDRLRG